MWFGMGGWKGRRCGGMEIKEWKGKKIKEMDIVGDIIKILNV